MELRNAWEKTVVIDNNFSQVFYQCAPDGLFIGVVTHGNYNVHIAPVQLP
jgi:hypothetical protein